MNESTSFVFYYRLRCGFRARDYDRYSYQIVAVAIFFQFKHGRCLRQYVTNVSFCSISRSQRVKFKLNLARRFIFIAKNVCHCVGNTNVILVASYENILQCTCCATTYKVPDLRLSYRLRSTQ